MANGKLILPDLHAGKQEWYRPDVEKKPGRKIYWTNNRINALGDVMVDWYENNHTKISLSAFCSEHKVPSAYISIFSKRSKYFNYCVQTTKDLLETRLLEMGLNGEIDKVMCIFSLKNIAGWTDKKEINSSIDVTSTIIELQLPKKKIPIEVKAEIIDVPSTKNKNS